MSGGAGDDSDSVFDVLARYPVLLSDAVEALAGAEQ
jgi:hypothetical protein